MRFIHFIVLLAMLSATSVEAQHKADSLLKLLPAAKEQRQIEILTLLSYELAYVNADSARDFGLQAAGLIADRSSVLYAEVLHNLAITHQVQSNYTEALRYDEQALDIYRSASDSLRIANTLNNIALIYDEQGRYKEAIDYYRKAYEIYKHRSDDEKIAVVALNLGVVYKGIGDYGNSILNYRGALGTFKLLDHDYGVAVCYVNIGSIFLSLPQYDSALKYSLLAEEMFHMLTFTRFEAVATGNAGIAYGKLGRPQEGMRYLEKAIALHKANDTRKELSFCYLKMAELYFDIKEYGRALPYAQQALEASINAGVLQQVADTHKLLAALYAEQGSYRNALASQQAYTQVHDSLFQIEKMKHVREFQVQYETEKKERELAETTAKLAIGELEIQQGRIRLVIAAGVILLIAIAGVVVYRAQRGKQQRLQFKAELAEAKARNAIQAERLRISQELHDNIGAQLTFLGASIESFGKAVTDPRLDEIRKLNTATIQELRKTVWLINRPSATLEEFVIKLREYMPSNTTPSLHLSAIGNLTVPIQATTANELFRIIQEGVNNAIKHAQASQIVVALVADDDALTVQIKDDGVGFDVHSSSSGFGLRNIERRIRSVSGTVTIHSGPTETSITVSIPI